MATFFTGHITSLETLEKMMRTLAGHKGKFFVGRDMASRKETNLAACIQAFYDAWDTEVHQTIYLTPAPKPRQLSRQQRWNEACNTAKVGLDTLLEIQQEITDWGENLGDGGSEATKDLIQIIEDLDIEGAISTMDEAENATLPQGFGRD